MDSDGRIVVMPALIDGAPRTLMKASFGLQNTAVLVVNAPFP